MPSTSKTIIDNGENRFKNSIGNTSLKTTNLQQQPLTFFPTKCSTISSKNLLNFGGLKSLLERRKETLKNKRIPIYKQKTQDKSFRIINNIKKEDAKTESYINEKDLKGIF